MPEDEVEKKNQVFSEKLAPGWVSKETGRRLQAMAPRELSASPKAFQTPDTVRTVEGFIEENPIKWQVSSD